MPSTPWDISVLTVTVVMIILLGSHMLYKVKRRRKRADAVRHTGIKTTGVVVGVLPQNSFDKERGRIDPRIKLTYTDPNTGRVETVKHTLHRYMDNLPLELRGSGAVDISALKAAYRADKDFRERLEAEGYSKAEITNASHERSLQLAQENSPVGTDSDGYLVLRSPIPVDVYMNSQNLPGKPLEVSFSS